MLVPNRRKRGQGQLEAEQVDFGAEVAKPRTVIERLIGDATDRWPRVHNQKVGRLDLMSSTFRVAFFLTRLFPPLVDCTHGGLDPSLSKEAGKKRRRAAEPRSAELEPAATAVPDVDVGELEFEL